MGGNGDGDKTHDLLSGILAEMKVQSRGIAELGEEVRAMRETMVTQGQLQAGLKEVTAALIQVLSNVSRGNYDALERRIKALEEKTAGLP